MDWSYYATEGTNEPEPSRFWSGPRPDVPQMVRRGDLSGLVNALTYDDSEIRSAAAASLTRIGALTAHYVNHEVREERRKREMEETEASGLGALFG